MTSGVRAPAVAGRFYPGHAEELLREVRKFTSADKTPMETGRVAAIGCVAPHAGYIYSGGVAGALCLRPANPSRSGILCPPHTRNGTPPANLPFPALHEASAAHRAEHAIEVQLPFLQALRPELNIVPIAVGTTDFDVLRGLGEALADVIADRHEEDREEKVLIVASSDMNHYEADAITRVKDHKAIERVLAMDARGLWEVVMNEDISMCGFGPTVVMLTSAKILGATSATLVKYATSGDVSGDYESVVGYARIIVE